MNWLTVRASLISDGRLFQWSTTLELKKFLLYSCCVLLGTRLCFAVLLLVGLLLSALSNHSSHSTLSIPLTILKVCTMSISILLSCRLGIPSSLSFSSYVVALRPEIALTALCWTDSRHWMSACVQGAQAATANSKCGLTYVLLIEAEENVSVPVVECSCDL